MTDKEMLETEQTELENTENDAMDEYVADLEGEVEQGKETEDTEGEDVQEEQPDPTEAKIKALEEKYQEELKTERDRRAITKGNLESYKKLLPALVEEYGDIEAAAEKIGMDVTRAKALLEGKGEADPVQAQVKVFDKRFNDMKAELDEAYGIDTATLADTYVQFAKYDQAELERFAELPQEKVVSYVLKKGKEYREAYEDVDMSNPVETIKALRAELKALKEQKVNTTGKAEEKAEEEQEVSQPKGRRMIGSDIPLLKEEKATTGGVIW